MFVQTFGMLESSADIPLLVELAFDPEYDPDMDYRSVCDSERGEFPSTCVELEFRLNFPILHTINATAIVFDTVPGCYEFDVYDLTTEEGEPLATGSCVRAPVYRYLLR